MEIKTENVILRKLTASQGMVITDKETQMLRSTVVYLGKDEDETNFIEIDENTPLPEPEQTIE